MKKLYLLFAIACLTTFAIAQEKEKYELGKPNNDAYRYLDDYQALKNYIDYEKYPNFKLGIGIIESSYLSTSSSLVKNLVNKNFTEFVAGNAMKMGSVVNGNGDMDFTIVQQLVDAATSSGLNLYGHTLAWHSQQPIAWLTKLLADKQTGDGWTVVASKNFATDHNISWKSNESQYGYSLSFNSDGLHIHCTKKNTNYWDVQFAAMDNITLQTGKTYKMTIDIKGSANGTLHSKLGDAGWSPETCPNIPFTTEWKQVETDYKPAQANNALVLQCGDFIGDIYIKSIKFEEYKGGTAPQTAQERHDTLVYAMDKWIKGMMEACNGKVKAWDLVNEAIGGGGQNGQDVDEEGNYNLQHSDSYNNDHNTWDVGGNAFYWQDILGDLDYVRQACRLARKYGPEDIKLFINDYNLESTWDDNKKLKSLINWIKKWEADGVTKIDGIGTQMHINCYEVDLRQSSIEEHIVKMFNLMAETKKICRISELDMGYIRGWNGEGDRVTNDEVTEAELRKMADFYEFVIKKYLEIIPPAQQWGICQWNITDSPDIKNYWRCNEPAGIWDLDYYRKHVYAGFVRGLNGGEPTGIQQVETDKGIDTSKGIYNLNGMRLKATSLDELPSGLYIVNGKKVVVK